MKDGMSKTIIQQTNNFDIEGVARSVLEKIGKPATDGNVTSMKTLHYVDYLRGVNAGLKDDKAAFEVVDDAMLRTVGVAATPENIKLLNTSRYALYLRGVSDGLMLSTDKPGLEPNLDARPARPTAMPLNGKAQPGAHHTNG